MTVFEGSKLSLREQLAGRWLDGGEDVRFAHDIEEGLVRFPNDNGREAFSGAKEDRRHCSFACRSLGR